MCNRRTPLDSLARDRPDVAPVQCKRGKVPQNESGHLFSCRNRLGLHRGRARSSIRCGRRGGETATHGRHRFGESHRARLAAILGIQSTTHLRRPRGIEAGVRQTVFLQAGFEQVNQKCAVGGRKRSRLSGDFITKWHGMSSSVLSFRTCSSSLRPRSWRFQCIGDEVGRVSGQPLWKEPGTSTASRLLDTAVVELVDSVSGRAHPGIRRLTRCGS